jgi:hypothetical protein
MDQRYVCSECNRECPANDFEVVTDDYRVCCDCSDFMVNFLGWLAQPPPAPPPAFTDCVLPEQCECARRGYPKWDQTKCMVPAVNETARALGWQEPYPDAGCERFEP